jgi:hypothetical protein
MDEPGEHADNWDEGEDLEAAPYGEQEAGKHLCRFV